MDRTLPADMHKAQQLAGTAQTFAITGMVLLGISIASRVLVVCHCYRRADEVIRIISARRATASERLDYARFLA